MDANGELDIHRDMDTDGDMDANGHLDSNAHLDGDLDTCCANRCGDTAGSRGHFTTCRYHIAAHCPDRHSRRPVCAHRARCHSSSCDSACPCADLDDTLLRLAAVSKYLLHSSHWRVVDPE